MKLIRHLFLRLKNYSETMKLAKKGSHLSTLGHLSSSAKFLINGGGGAEPRARKSVQGPTRRA